MLADIFYKSVAAVLIPVLLYLGYVAVSWGLADVYYRPGKAVLERWKRKEAQLEQQDWDRMRRQMDRALKLAPSNPDIMHACGSALEGRYIRNAPGDRIAQPARRQAADYYRAAISRRPTWPFTWADLALVKYRLDELDDEFYHALYQSTAVGPWEPGVQRVVAYIGLKLWDRLTGTDREFIRKTILRSLEHANTEHVSGMLEMLEEFDFL